MPAKTCCVLSVGRGRGKGKGQAQAELHFIDENEPVKSWEYAVRVCNAHYELHNIGQLYRDRADCRIWQTRGFDEIKNQWGWGGYSTHDIERCALSARAVALVYNGWSWYVRLAHTKTRLEPITSPQAAQRSGQADQPCRPEQDFADNHARSSGTDQEAHRQCPHRVEPRSRDRAAV